MGCLRDITERNAQRLAQVEVARVTQRLGMGEMAASIAHEIKQPLAAITSNGYAALRWLANPTPNLDEVRDALKRIVNDSQRANEVVAGIRSMFKNEGQAKAPQDVNKLIREIGYSGWCSSLANRVDLQGRPEIIHLTSVQSPRRGPAATSQQPNR